jgi:hypothetical protein
MPDNEKPPVGRRSLLGAAAAAISASAIRPPALFAQTRRLRFHTALRWVELRSFAFATR